MLLQELGPVSLMEILFSQEITFKQTKHVVETLKDTGLATVSIADAQTRSLLRVVRTPLNVITITDNGRKWLAMMQELEKMISKTPTISSCWHGGNRSITPEQKGRFQRVRYHNAKTELLKGAVGQWR
jgi:predicted transcriptional regulator